jgi:integrase
MDTLTRPGLCLATSLLARRNSPKVVQDLLRHSSITVTLDLYTAALDELGVDAVESLENQFAISNERNSTGPSN